MTPERYDQVFDWFSRLVDAAPDDRDALLADAETHDPALRAELEALWTVHESDDAAVAGVVEREAAAWADQGAQLERIGRYRIVHKIADGGMGTVFLAEQDQPKRDVALKVIRGGLASDDAIRRFELEGQLLGALDHPGIATIYEAGTESTPLGPLPFFAMEYVRGKSLDEHARSLDYREKLRLLARVCDAVQHAHRKGIVHRDLKPANVVVDSSGAPKVLDFGVARLTEDEARTQTLRGQLVGTLPYMSPEQIRGEASQVDTRADVYALGAIACELLTGHPPHDVDAVPITEAARTILEDTPRRVSSSDARLRGDVETIVSTALAKDVNRRYPSAEALAADIRHYLADEPIAARPASAAYVLGKFAQRHKSAVAVGTLVLLGLIGGLITTSRLAASEKRQRERADAKADEASRETYRAQIAAADAAMQVPDLGGARRFLEAVPQTQRAWEWRYLYAQLDDSTETHAAADATARGWLLGLAVTPEQVVTLHSGHAERASTVRVLRGEHVEEHDLAPGRWTLSSSGSVLTRLQEGNLWVHGIGEAKGRALVEDGSVRAVHEFDAEGAQVLITQAKPDTDLEVLHWIDVATGTSTHEWPQTQAIECVAVAPTGLGVAAGMGKTIHVFAPGQSEPRMFKGHATTIESLAFSPKGRRLISVDRAGEMRLWTVEGGHVLEQRAGRREEFGPVSFDSDGRFIAGVFADGTLRLIEASTLIERARLSGQSDEYATLPPRFVANGADIVSGRRDGTVQRFASDLVEGFGTLDAHTNGATCVAWAPEGRRVATAGADGFLRVWNADSQQPIGSIDMDVARLPTGKCLVESVQFLEQGKVLSALALADAGRSRAQYDAFGAGPLGRVRRPAGRVFVNETEFEGTHLVDLPDGHPVFTRASSDAADAWRVMRTRPGKREGTSLEDTLFEVPARPISAAFEDRTGQVHVLCLDGIVRSTNAGGSTAVVTRDLSRWEPTQLVMLDGGHRWLVRTHDTALLVFDPGSLQPVLTLRGHSGGVRHLAIAPTGQTIASVSDDGTLRLWAPTGRGERQRARKAQANRSLDTDALVELALAESPDGDTTALFERVAQIGDYDPAVREDARNRLFGRHDPRATTGVRAAGTEHPRLERVFEVQLDKPGAEPRHRLQYAATSTPCRLQIDEEARLRMALGGLRFPATSIPKRTIALRFDRVAELRGDLLADVVVEAFELPRHPMVAQMRDALPDMAQVVDARLRLRVPMNAHQRTLEIVDADFEPGNALRILEIVDEAFSDTLIPLPDKPVGIGATWRVVETTRLMSIEVRTIRTYEVLAINASTARLRYTKERRAPKQDIQAPTASPQTRMTMTAFESRTDGEVVWVSTLPILQHLKLESKQHIGADVDVRGIKQSVSLDLDSTTTAETK